MGSSPQWAVDSKGYYYNIFPYIANFGNLILMLVVFPLTPTIEGFLGHRMDYAINNQFTSWLIKITYNLMEYIYIFIYI